MKRVLWALLILFGACTGGGGGEIDGDGGPLADGGSTPDAGADMGPAEPPPFVLRMHADTGIAVVGQAVRIDATPGGLVPGELDFRWAADGGVGVAEGSVFVVRFDAPGPQEVTVEARAGDRVVESGVLVMVYAEAPRLGDVDGDGATDAADRERLRAFLAAEASLDDASEARADLDRDLDLDAEDLALLDTLLRGEPLIHLAPAAGSRGTLTQLMHPALLDPAARFTARFDGEPVPLHRGAPGYATVVVPLEAGAPRGITLELLMGEEVVHGFAFDVLEPPAVAGSEVPDAYAALQATLDVMPGLMDAWLAELDVGADDRALMTAMFQGVAEQLAEQRAAFATQWDQLSPEQQRIYTEIALANGLDDALAELDTIADRLRAGVLEIRTERLIELVCLARDLTSVAQTIAKVNNIAAYVIDAAWFLSFFVPALAPVVAGLQTANTFIAAVMDAMQLLLDFVPRFGDQLTLGADPSTIMRGAETTIAASIKVQIAGGLCAGGAGVATHLLLDRLKTRLFERLFGRIPGFGRIYRRARNQRTMIARLVTSIARFLGQIIDVVLDASGIEARFQAMAAAVCEAVVPGQPWALDPGGLRWEETCGIVVDGTWACTPECADQQVRITATLTVCGAPVQGHVDVECAPCRASCPDGCCTADGECIDMADQAAAQCGAEGRRCRACAADQVCEDGECACESTCAAADLGLTRCADGETVETCEAASDGCFRWTATDCAAGGATCEDGACVGGCGAWNCAGCCTGERDCVAEDAQDEAVCGRDGRACAACGPDDACVGGRCECQGPACDPPPRAGSRGDPHLVTHDGLAYDFQGAGAFVLTRDAAERGLAALEVQVRQAPTRDPACVSAVTVNRAVAVRVGASRVTFDPARAQPIWVDGVAVELSEDEPWALGDAELLFAGRGTWWVRWADGSAVRLDRRGAVDVGVVLAPGRAMVGLLGDADGDPTNDLRRADGAVLAQPAIFEALYGGFADDWRVDAASSLFDHDPGESVTDWTIPNYPTSLADPSTLDEAVRVSAEALCAGLGIDDPIVRDACVLDIACTGDPGMVGGLIGLPPPVDRVEVTPPEAPPVPPAVREACSAASRDFEGQVGGTFTHDCPAECADLDCNVWGSDVYSDDSCLCRAAIHAGVLAAGEAGRVEVQRLEGQPSYRGSERNGVATRDYGAWGGSFQFPAAIPACKRTGADLLVFEPIGGCRDGNWYCHDCPEACEDWPVWGTDNYHENSSLCLAAAHAGVIDRAEGGRVFFTFPIFDEAYRGSVQNGVESLDRDPHPVSFEFRRQ